MRVLLFVAWFWLFVEIGSAYSAFTTPREVEVVYLPPPAVAAPAVYTSLVPCVPWAAQTRMNQTATWPGDAYICTIGPRSRFIWEHAQRD